MFLADVTRRIQHEAIDGAVFVDDGEELLLAVVLKFDAGAGLDARRQSPHALILEADVVVAVASVNDVSLGIILELAEVGVGLGDSSDATEEVMLPALGILVRIDDGVAAASGIVLPAGGGTRRRGRRCARRPRRR